MERKQLAAGTALLLVASAVPVLAQPAPPPQGDPVAGERAYLDAGCSACHGTIGHGGGIAGPKIAPGPVPFFVFNSQLRNPARNMPRYSTDLLSQQQAADIYAYLQAIPDPVDPDRIPILSR